LKFLSLNNELSNNGVLSKEKNIFNFNFKKVKFQYESYRGDLVCLKYFIRVNIVKTMRTFSYDEEFAVIKPYDAEILKKNDEPISMHVGIKDLLNILIELNHINYSIHGTLKGGVTFGKVKLLITKMELQLIKKETIYNNTNSDKNSKTKVVASYELIDGGPYKNETIPFRLFLSAYNLTPTYKDISGYFSTRYYLNLVFKDQEDNRYFKQKEIFLFRLFLENNNKINKNNIEYLKDFITEPIDYGDYFSSFNIDDDIDDDKKNKNDLIKTKTKELEPSDFFFKSNLKGFISDEDINDDNFINIKNRSNSVFDIKINKDILGINDEDKDDEDYLNENNKYKDDNYIIKKNKKNNNKKNNTTQRNKVINIKEKNKYKNNDILINDNNYYNINSINDNEDDKELFADTLITSYFNSNYSQIGNKK
jgi:vacuolar protein sorting-associated protein 26